MRQFSISEIKSILGETANAQFVFDENDRQRALTNPYIKGMRERLIRDGNDFRGTPITEIPFSAFSVTISTETELNLKTNTSKGDKGC